MRTWANSYAVYDRKSEEVTVIDHRRMTNTCLCDEEIYLDTFEYEALIHPEDRGLFQACLDAMSFEMSWVDVDDEHPQGLFSKAHKVYVIGDKQGEAVCCTSAWEVRELLEDPSKYLYAVYRKELHEAATWEINYLMKNFSMFYVDAKNAAKGVAAVTNVGVVRARHEIPPVGAADRYHYDFVVFIDGNESRRVHTPTELSCEDSDAVFYEENSDDDEHHTSSSTNHDYSPSDPWNAPGMSIKDFI